jgi:hypothetical protein
MQKFKLKIRNKYFIQLTKYLSFNKKFKQRLI